MRRALFALFVSLFLAAPTHADNAPRTSAYFYAEDEGDEASTAFAASVNRVFRVDMRKNKLVSYVELNLVLDSDNPPYMLAIEQAKKKYAEGVSQLKASKADKAVPILNEAFLLYLSAFSFTQDATEVREICLDLAKAAFLSRKPIVSAETAFRRALLLDPSLTFQVDRYENPRLEEPFLAAQKSISDAPKGKFRVDSTPKAAEVYIDGSYAGITPVEVPNLGVGEHFLTVRRDGYERYNDLIVVSEKTTESTAAYLNELPRAPLLAEVVSASRLEAGKTTLVGDSAILGFKTLGALNIVVLGSVEPVDDKQIKVTAYVYDLRSRQRINRKERDFNATSPALDAELAAFSREVLLDAKKKPIPLDGKPLDEKQLLCTDESSKNDPNCKTEKPSIFLRPWFIPTAVGGAAVVGLGVAAALGAFTPQFQCNDGSCVGTGLP